MDEKETIHGDEALEPDKLLRAAEAVALLKPILSEHSARRRICERAHGGLIRARAEQFHVGQRVLHDQDVPKNFWWAEGHEALEQDWTSGDFSTWIDHRVQVKAFGVSFYRADIQKLLPPLSRLRFEGGTLSEDDQRIIRELDNLVPSAAASYKQAILDLRDDGRVSFRGPALEMREALREVIDHLAPDDLVMTDSAFVLEKERVVPTTRQKVRFILKRNGSRFQSDAAEIAVGAFEEAVAKLTRAVYERSSRATHVASEKQDVDQLRRYMVAVLHDILG